MTKMPYSFKTILSFGLRVGTFIDLVSNPIKFRIEKSVALDLILINH